MNILDRLNAGDLHRAARTARPDCVDALGNIHNTPARAAFVDWATEAKAIHGQDVGKWPEPMRAEYAARYVPSH